MDATKTPGEHHPSLVDKVEVMLPMGGAMLSWRGLVCEVKCAGADGSGSHCRLVRQAGWGWEVCVVIGVWEMDLLGRA